MKGTAAVLTHFKGRKLAALFVDGQLQALPADKLTRLLPGDSLEIAVQEVAGDVPLTE